MMRLPAELLILDGKDGSRLLVRAGHKERLARLTPDGLAQRLPHAPIIGRSGRSEVRRIDIEDGPSLAARPYRHGGLLGGSLGSLGIGATRALRELQASELARARGVATPEVSAIFFARSRFRDPYLLTLVVEESRSLPDLAGAPWSDRRSVVMALADCVASMFRAGLEHVDLNLSNFIVGPGAPPRVLVIDLDKARIHQSLDPSLKLRMLRRMARSWHKLRAHGLPLRARDALLFLREIAQRDEELMARSESLSRELGRSFPLHALTWRSRRCSWP